MEAGAMMAQGVTIHSDGWPSADTEERSAEKERIREVSRGTRLGRGLQGYKEEVACQGATFRH